MKRREAKTKGGKGDDKGQDGWMSSLSLSELQEMVKDRKAQSAVVREVKKSQT